MLYFSSFFILKRHSLIPNFWFKQSHSQSFNWVVELSLKPWNILTTPLHCWWLNSFSPPTQLKYTTQYLTFRNGIYSIHLTPIFDTMAGVSHLRTKKEAERREKIDHVNNFDMIIRSCTFISFKDLWEMQQWWWKPWNQ